MSSAIFFLDPSQMKHQSHLYNIHPHPLALAILLGALLHQTLAKNSEADSIQNQNINKIDDKNVNNQYRMNLNEEYDYRNYIDSLNSNRNVEIDSEKENEGSYEGIITENNSKDDSNNDITNNHQENNSGSEEIEKKFGKLLDITNKKSSEHLKNKKLSKPDSNQPKSRQKRVLWLTEDGRLALPPGTTMVITPSLSMPFVRYPPEGFFSNITISLPFTIDFNKLGLTDNENPYGVLPPVLARSMGRAAGGILADYIGSVFEHRRGKRSPENRPPAPPSSKIGHFHGGERALLYVALEELLENFGLDGRACLLRAICEVHAHPMKGFGLVGEILKLFLSASESPYSDLMKDYVKAENAGKGGLEGHGECWPYMKDCPKSLFLMKHNKYSEDVEENEVESDNFELNDQQLKSDVTYHPNMRNM